MNRFLKKTLKNFSSLAEVAEDAVFCIGALPLDKETRTEYLEDVELFDAFSTYTYIFNTERELFQNENVRRALSMVLDREYLAEELVFAKVADGFISPAVWDSVKKKTSFRSEAESLIVTTAKLEEARALLAGVDTDEEITITIRDTVDEVLIANHAQEQWGKLGFEVVINRVKEDTEIWSDVYGRPGREVEVGSKITVYDDGIQAAYISGKFDVLGLDYNMYSTNAFTALCGFSTLLNGNGVEYAFDANGLSVAKERLHCSRFSDPAYDAIIDRAFAEKDLKKRAAILHEAETYLLSKMPIAPIVYNQNYYLVDEIGGMDYDGYGNPIFNSARLKADVAKAPATKED